MDIVALEWQSWPLRQQNLKPRALLILLLVGIIWLILLMSLPIMGGVALGIALLLSLLPYYLPNYYRVDEDGITVRQGLGLNTRKRKWSDFVRYEVRPNGYLLSPFDAAQTNRLEPLRALFLPNPTDTAAQTLLQSLLSRHFDR